MLLLKPSADVFLSKHKSSVASTATMSLTFWCPSNAPTGMMSSTWGSSVCHVERGFFFSPNDEFSCSNSLGLVIDGLMSGFFGSASLLLKQPQAFFWLRSRRIADKTPLRTRKRSLGALIRISDVEALIYICSSFKSSH